MSVQAPTTLISSLQWDGSKWLEPLVQSTVEDIIADPLHQRTGIQVYFLPRVDQLLSDHYDILSSRFCIPKFFWTAQAYHANGFFGSQDGPLVDFSGENYSTYSRFLIKELLHTQHNFGYDWQYMAFSTLWYTFDDAATQILFCFDLSPMMKALITAEIKASNPASVLKCPLAIYDVLMATIVTYFDQTTWAFVAPIRHLEKSRTSSTVMGVNRDMVIQRFSDMHELWRHLIHALECLNVAKRTVRAISESHAKRCGSSSSSLEDLQVKNNLQFYGSLLENMGDRVHAFEQRLQNEISLAFNLSAADDNAIAMQIAKATRKDSQAMKTIAILTLAFLPSTFISAIFSMSFFNYTPGTDGRRGKWSVSEHFWVYWAVALPVTAITVSMWLFWDKSFEGNGRTSDATGLDTLWIGVDKPKSKLDPVYPI